ncbi:glutamate-cysteine ligase catalytic subunit [Russula vinacea]|nr:glutamate-cysteine ligase catalytic subunit [Russula vinacea]
MGLLSLGTPLDWEQAKPFAEHVRSHGITQFLNTWDRLKGRFGDELLWGDEIEYMIVQLDSDSKDAVLSLCQTDILAKLQNPTSGMDAKIGADVVPPVFHPEYGRFMLESTPGAPYTGSVRDLVLVEFDMRLRRQLARSKLKRNQIPMTLTSFPRLGVPGRFTVPHYDPAGAISSHSLFLPEQITNPHARFPTLTANIRRRRGSKVAVNLPIYIDRRTPRPFVDPTIPWHRNLFPEDAEARHGAALNDHIYMDAMGFGMGCCCLQLTFQCCNIEDARWMYDALIPVGPIMLALTAASPLWRGYIADVDCRWNVIAGSVDDRTEEERGLKAWELLLCLSTRGLVHLRELDEPSRVNDNPLPIDQGIYDRMREHGIDELLSKHIAHLFIRDPIVVFSEMLEQDDSKSMDHFENIQSTNWQTLRFKPPPPNSPIGWRVEFRSMEVQMTDFENAAFAVFIVLLSRAIMSMNVDQNMHRAQQRDAVNQARFYFRRNVFTPAPSRAASGATTPEIAAQRRRKQRVMENCFPPPPLPEEGLASGSVKEEYGEYTMNEIINGRTYIGTLDLSDLELRKIASYLDLVRRRANGSLKTNATWIRDFVRSHPSYEFDSAVNKEMNYDLVVAVDEM